MRIEPFQYIRPRTTADAISALEEHGAAAKVLAGGSDLIVRMKLGIVSPRYIVDIKQVPELNYIRVEGGKLRIGAMATLSAIERSPLVRQSSPALAKAAGQVASLQIRNAATITGNICLETMCWYYNQSRQWKKSRPLCNKAGGEICHVVNKPGVCYATYRGDTAVALIALEAEATIQNAAGQRTIPLEKLFTGDGVSPFGLAPQEMITGVEVPQLEPLSGCAYYKIAHRNAVDYPQAAVGATIKLGPDGRCKSARIVLGAVAPGPVRAKQAEAMLVGQEIVTDLLDAVAEAAVRDAHPVNNMTHGSPSYRRKMVRILTRKALDEAALQAGLPIGGSR